MNSIVLVGKIAGELNEKTKYLEIGRIEYSEEDNNILVPVRYWTRDRRNFFQGLEKGKLVAIRGRIDTDKKIGLLIIAEQVTVIK